MTARKLRPDPLPRRDAALSEAQERFVESVGVLYERMGVPRIGGRMLGLFFLSDQPISAERIAEVLRVSRASVSINLRVFLSSGLCERVNVAGDRRNFYLLNDDAFATQLDSSVANIRKLGALCREGIRTLPAGRSAARRRMQEAVDYCGFIENEITSIARRWRARRKS